MKAFQPIKDSMGGSGPMPLVFLDEEDAKDWATDNKEEWTQYKVKEVEVRKITAREGAVGDQLVQIHKSYKRKISIGYIQSRLAAGGKINDDAIVMLKDLGHKYVSRGIARDRMVQMLESVVKQLRLKVALDVEERERVANNIEMLLKELGK